MDVITIGSSDTVMGAFLASLFGIGTFKWQQWSERRRVRSALGSLLHTELSQSTPQDDPLSQDPRTARLLSFAALSPLLAPGIIDPECEKPLFRDLVYLYAVMKDFNDKASTYNAAWASGAPQETLKKCYNDLQMSNRDYQDAHRSLFKNVSYLGQFRSMNEPPRCALTFQLYRLLQRIWRNQKRRFFG